MKLNVKLVAAIAVLVLAVAGLVFLSSMYSATIPMGGSDGNYTMEVTLDRDDFVYGPQSWKPYESKLPVVPGSATDGDNRFVMAFVDLRNTLGKNITDSKPIEVEYIFKWLKGTAAFHVYGYKGPTTVAAQGEGISWTNRVEGAGASGLYVTGAESGSLQAGGVATADNHGYVRVSNDPMYDEFGNGTYLVKFNKPGGGLNALQILASPDGSPQVIYTSNQTGKFYVASGSDNSYDTLLLLVAVNGTMPGDFQLRIRAGH
ncbi:MAG: hypothetical protein A4E28_00147 [Methanocella sp. PtaU1.Bin125]|nr:MAG: hypothetical protein A4E28_00147 [Methanocella sp. PtaU1.Bin125]